MKRYLRDLAPEDGDQFGIALFLLDHLDAMVAYWDANEVCVFANNAYRDWFGKTKAEVIGHTLQELLGPLYPLNLPYIQGALRGEVQEFEREIPDPSKGPARHMQAHYIPHVVAGVVQGFCVLVTDITRRKRAEQALHEMEQRMQARARLAALTTLAADTVALSEFLAEE